MITINGYLKQKGEVHTYSTSVASSNTSIIDDPLVTSEDNTLYTPSDGESGEILLWLYNTVDFFSDAAHNVLMGFYGAEYLMSIIYRRSGTTTTVGSTELLHTTYGEVSAVPISIFASGSSIIVRYSVSPGGFPYPYFAGNVLSYHGMRFTFLWKTTITGFLSGALFNSGGLMVTDPVYAGYNKLIKPSYRQTWTGPVTAPSWQTIFTPDTNEAGELIIYVFTNSSLSEIKKISYFKSGSSTVLFTSTAAFSGCYVQNSSGAIQIGLSANISTGTVIIASIKVTRYQATWV